MARFPTCGSTRQLLVVVVVAVAVAFLAPAVAAQSGSSAWLAPSWRATFHGTRVDHKGIDVGSLTITKHRTRTVQGEIFYDVKNSRSTVAVSIHEGNATLLDTLMQVGGYQYKWLNGVCTLPPIESPFFELWDEYKRVRSVLENGRVVDIYHHIRNGPNATLAVDHQTGLPLRSVRTRFSHSHVYHAPHSIDFSVIANDEFTLSFDASVVSAWPTNPSSSPFTPPPVCLTSTGLVCPTESSVIANISMMRLHDANKYSLANQNTGDLTGDVQYLCSRFTPATFHVNDTSLVSIFTVAVNTSFAQYSFCNFDFCYGWTDNGGRVGRRINAAIFQYGQCEPVDCCTNNGTWFSLPAQGQCAASQAIEGGGCFWKSLERVKTISLACVLSSTKFASACLLEVAQSGTMWSPHPRAVLELEQAFASCPDIPPSSSSSSSV